MHGWSHARDYVQWQGEGLQEIGTRSDTGEAASQEVV
jgi:hypothetical protein